MTLARRAMLALSIALATALLVGALAAIDAATVRKSSNGFNVTEHGRGRT